MIDVVHHRGARTCPACDAQLVRRYNERPNQFARRATCGRVCTEQLRRQARDEPTTCTCPTPEPGGLGECRQCRRPVIDDERGAA